MFLLTLGLINLLWLYLHLWSSSQPTNTGERNFISIIDDHTRFVRLYALHTKSQTTNVFLPFKQMLENYLIALLRPYKQMMEESLCLWWPCWKRMVYCIDAHVPILVKKNDMECWRHRIGKSGLTMHFKASMRVSFGPYAFKQFFA